MAILISIFILSYHAGIDIIADVVHVFDDILGDIEFDAQSKDSIVLIYGVLDVFLLVFGKDLVIQGMVWCELFFLSNDFVGKI